VPVTSTITAYPSKAPDLSQQKCTEMRAMVKIVRLCC